jgi:hypothetical protein
VNGKTEPALYGFLIDPNGEPVSEKTNQRADGTLVGSLQISAVNPQAGRWRVAARGVSDRGPAPPWRRPFTGKVFARPGEVSRRPPRAELAVPCTSRRATP